MHDTQSQEIRFFFCSIAGLHVVRGLLGKTLCQGLAHVL